MLFVRDSFHRQRCSQAESKRMEKKIFHVNADQKQVVVAIFISVDFKQKLIRRDKKRQRRPLYPGKGNNSIRRYKDNKYIFSKCQRT